MLETLLIWIVFLFIDVILCIKRVPIAGFIIGIMQLFLVYSYMMNDVEFSIYLSLVSGCMAGLMILINALELKK